MIKLKKRKMKTNWREPRNKTLDQNTYMRNYMIENIICGVVHRVNEELGQSIYNQIDEVWDRVYHQTKEEINED
jgi:hypothetical protein